MDKLTGRHVGNDVCTQREKAIMREMFEYAERVGVGMYTGQPKWVVCEGTRIALDRIELGDAAAWILLQAELAQIKEGRIR